MMSGSPSTATAPAEPASSVRATWRRSCATWNPVAIPTCWSASDTGDDAPVWRRPDGRALVATVDFFTPIVDDARIWGRIAAANSVSDVYAMGGSPLFGLNLVAWPPDKLRLDLLGEVLAGGATGRRRPAAGWSPEATPSTAPSPCTARRWWARSTPTAMLTNAGGQPGDALVLTKAIGTGIITTAIKRGEPADVRPGGRLAEAYEAAVAGWPGSTGRRPWRPSPPAPAPPPTSPASGCSAISTSWPWPAGCVPWWTSDAVPVLPGAWRPGRRRLRPRRYRSATSTSCAPTSTGEADERALIMLADAQTSGGLLFACPPSGGRGRGRPRRHRPPRRRHRRPVGGPPR